MKKPGIGWVYAFILTLALIGNTAFAKCNRACLIKMMDKYLAALVKHDPSAVPLGKDVMLVENSNKTQIGKGLWATATAGPKDFKIYVADPTAGQIGFLGIIQEGNKPVMLGARLKLVNGKITEIDHLVTRDIRDVALPNLQKPRLGLIQPLKPSERVSREQMTKIAYSYYDALDENNGKLAPFADECQRRENGVVSSNDQAPLPADSKESLPPSSIFLRMKCGDQISTGIFVHITTIDQRRVIAVDEEMGLVFAYSMFNISGEPKVRKITGVPGIDTMPSNYSPLSQPAAHVFKIKKGKIYEIEAMGYRAPYGIKNGWE